MIAECSGDEQGEVASTSTDAERLADCSGELEEVGLDLDDLDG